MFYTCTHCAYTFSSSFPPTDCPDCGKQPVRQATNHEVLQRLAAKHEEDIYLAKHHYKDSERTEDFQT